jgi:hypothetical protein
VSIAIRAIQHHSRERICCPLSLRDELRTTLVAVEKEVLRIADKWRAISASRCGQKPCFLRCASSRLRRLSSSSASQR